MHFSNTLMDDWHGMDSHQLTVLSTVRSLMLVYKHLILKLYPEINTRIQCSDIFIFPTNLLFSISMKKVNGPRGSPVFLSPQFAAIRKWCCASSQETQAIPESPPLSFMTETQVSGSDYSALYLFHMVRFHFPKRSLKSLSFIKFKTVQFS